ncbi:hypothetical protein [Helicobacter pylori]
MALVDFGGDEILNIQRFLQRFLNLSFQISFCCKTLKGVGGYYNFSLQSY